MFKRLAHWWNTHRLGPFYALPEHAERILPFELPALELGEDYCVVHSTDELLGIAAVPGDPRLSGQLFYSGDAKRWRSKGGTPVAQGPRHPVTRRRMAFVQLEFEAPEPSSLRLLKRSLLDRIEAHPDSTGFQPLRHPDLVAAVRRADSFSSLFGVLEAAGL